MTTQTSTQFSPNTAPPTPSGSEENNFISVSTIATYNLLQDIFGQIGYKEGQGEAEMTKLSQESGMKIARQSFLKGMLSAVGGGIEGAATAAGGAYSAYSMASVGKGPELEALDKEIPEIEKYQQALNEKASPELKLEDKSEIEMEDFSAKEPPREMTAHEKARMNMLKKVTDVKDLDIERDQDMIKLLDPESGDFQDIKSNMDNLHKEKTSARRDLIKTQFDEANIRSNAVTAMSTGGGEILKSVFSSISSSDEVKQQLWTQAKQSQDKSIQDLDQDPKNNAQTMVELQQLGQSVERTRSAN